MKIAFVYDVIYPYVKGGVEKRIRELAQRLAARGHDVHIVGMKFWEGPDTIIMDGVTLHGICPSRPLYAGGRRMPGEAIYFSIRLFPFLAREDFDITDCQQFPFFPCFPVMLISAVRKRSWVITWHEVWGRYWYIYLGPAGAFGKAIERLVAKLPCSRIAVSRTTAEGLTRLGLTGTPVIIPNGIDLRRVRSTPPHPETSDVIFVGRLIREKHVDLLIRAFVRLTRELPGSSLLIIGDGPERAHLEELVRELGMGNRVKMIPFEETHDEVIARMKASHICVIPSTREGFGIAALEALACGLPVVTVDCPNNAIRELVTSETGFLASLSEEDLAVRIREALVRYPSMRDACLNTADAFDWEGIVTRLESQYRSAISEK